MSDQCETPTTCWCLQRCAKPKTCVLASTLPRDRWDGKTLGPITSIEITGNDGGTVKEIAK